MLADNPNFVDFQPSLLEKTRPINRKQTIERAIDYVWSTALLFRIIKMKIDFVGAEFKIYHEDNKVNDFFNNLYEELDINTFIKNSAFYYFVLGEWYPYWNWEENKPNYITLLNPKLTKTKTVFGKDFIYLYPSSDINYLLNSEDDEIRRELRKIVPAKYLSKWKKGEPVYLDDAKRYVNLKEYREKYAHSPLEPIFPDLEIIRTLQEADYATARKLKQLLLHVKVGDQNFNNGEPVPKEILDKTKEYFENPSRAMEIFTQWFIDVEWEHPPVEIFNEDKYASAVKRILQWSGIEVMFASEGSYSEGSIKMKGMKQSIDKCRDEIEKSLNAFNKEVAERNGFTYYGKPKIPRIHFSQTALEDSQQVSDLIKYLYNMGILSMEDTLKYAGFDSKAQLEKKEKENNEYEDKGIVKPLFESNAGLLKEEDGTDDTTKDTNSQPRPN